MKLYEYQAKELFRQAGLPVPQGAVVRSAAEVQAAAAGLGFPVMAKSQLLTGKRGKAGLIRKCHDLGELEAAVSDWLGRVHQGETIGAVLVEQALDIQREMYLSVTPDPALGAPIIIASGEGGMEIEELSAAKPEAVLKEPVNVFRGLRPYQVRDVLAHLGLTGESAKAGQAAVNAVYRFFRAKDAELVEINPLALDRQGNLWAADGKIRVDDNALFRQKEFVRGREQFDDDLEFEAARNGLSYVKLEGDIGVLCTGAGLTMTVLDLIRLNGGTPANFMEFGGATYMKAATALALALKNPRVKVVLICTFGLVARADVIAEGLVKAIQELKPTLPIVTAVRGTGEERARELIKSIGIPTYDQTEEAVRRAVALARA